jgi:2-aminoadipate transaminase
MFVSTTARIDRLQRQAASKENVIGFAGGLPDPRYFPKRDLSDAFFQALHRPTEALQYGWPEGEPELRQWVAKRLQTRGARLGPEHIIVTSGAQQAIVLAARALFSTGQTVGLADSSYPGAIGTLRSLGLGLTSWRERAAGYYLMPAIGNPDGQSMTTEDRTTLLQRLRDEGSTLIEDDAYVESRFDGRLERALVADAPDRVIHVGTLSKVLCPGLRVGWLATRHPALPRILADKQQADLQSASLTQRVVVEYLRRGRFERHLERIRRGYERKAKLLRDAVLRMLPDFRVDEPRGGLSLWLQHQAPVAPSDDLTLLSAALRHGVSFDPGRPFLLHESKRLALRLCYGSVPAEDIEAGVARLAEAWRGLCRRRTAPSELELSR